MGARSPACLNQGWMGLVDKQVVNSAARGDLTPRRGLVYDANRFVIYYGLSEGGL